MGGQKPWDFVNFGMITKFTALCCLEEILGILEFAEILDKQLKVNENADKR